MDFYLGTYHVDSELPAKCIDFLHVVPFCRSPWKFFSAFYHSRFRNFQYLKSYGQKKKY